MKKTRFIGVDLFAGAGGMSLGANMAGVDVKLAIEVDQHAAATYSHNHPNSTVITNDIRNIKSINVPKNGRPSILFGGPPCQGFSTSNQRTRSKQNPSNWMFKEFIRMVCLWEPDWVVFENVRGITETERGLFQKIIINEFENINYRCSSNILCASDHGVPQVRSRFFLVASKHGHSFSFPEGTCHQPVTVEQAISDLPSLENGANHNYLTYPKPAQTAYAKLMRKGDGCHNHIVTRNARYVLTRYKHIPEGGNWEDIPKRLMKNYTDSSRCHTGIYRRLKRDKPSVVLGNYRKNMLIHPWENRGLSVREAARLQSFPDDYVFMGSIGFQQQQVGNAVPPALAKSVFEKIMQTEETCRN